MVRCHGGGIVSDLSLITEMVQCEHRTLHSRSTAPTVAAHAWFGVGTHNQLTGRVDGETPARVAFDGTTPTQRVMDRQIPRCVDQTRQALTNRGLTVMDYQPDVVSMWDRLSGILPVLCHDQEREPGWLLLQTKLATPDIWLRVAVVLLHYPTVFGGVIVTPRQPLTKRADTSIELRDADGLMRVAEQHQHRLQSILDGATAPRTPGLWCRRCNVSCPVRFT